MPKACTIFFNARSKPDTYTVPSCFHSKFQFWSNVKEYLSNVYNLCKATFCFVV